MCKLKKPKALLMCKHTHKTSKYLISLNVMLRKSLLNPLVYSLSQDQGTETEDWANN